jgi:hypothetical protein
VGWRHGAARLTKDFDCLVRHELANLDRLAAAMRELGARLRAEGLSDEESKALPVQMDGKILARNEISTWRTDAGDFDVLVNIPDRNGRRLTYKDLAGRAVIAHGTGLCHPGGRPGRHHCVEGVGQPPQRPSCAPGAACLSRRRETRRLRAWGLNVRRLPRAGPPSASAGVVPLGTSQGLKSLGGPAPGAGLGGPRAERG